LPFDAEGLARTALVRILPRTRYRLAAPNDARFAAFAPQTVRIAYRQQGAEPAFLLFSGPGQDPRAAALEAARWAEANWRPSAIQRRVRPGVVVVQVAPASELAPAGPVPGAAVPAAIWTVDSESGRVEVAGRPPGSPPAGEIKRASSVLARGEQPPPLGELDLAERSLMQVRTRSMPLRLSGVVGIVIVLFALRFGLSSLVGVLSYGSLIGRSPVLGLVGVVANALLVVGVLLGVGVLLNFRNLAWALPGVSSPQPRTRTLTWAGYAVVMGLLALTVSYVLPRSFPARAGGGQNVSATVADDGAEVGVAAGGTLTVDLSGWPKSEWSGVRFKTSNPVVLTLDATPEAGGPPVARYRARQAGVARVDATSADGKFSFQLRVVVAGG
jgi:hypothetical protein